MITGGLGLFLEPGGRPLGRRTTSMVAPSPPEELGLCAVVGVTARVRLSSSAAESWKGLCGKGWC